MRRVFALIVSISSLTLLAACGDQYSNRNSTTTDPTEVTTASGDSTPDPSVPAPQASEEIIAMLTVTTVDVSKCLTLTGAETTGVVSIKIGALELPIPQGPRLWNDAISIPLAETEPLKQLSETQASICEDTLLGATWGHFFSQMEVGGRKLLDLNPWLEVFNVPEDQINDVATGFIPLLDVSDPSDELKQEAVEKAIEWQVLAAKVNTLLERITVLGVDEQQSLLNYHLIAGGLVVGALPEVGLNPNQESLPALMLVVTEKGACVPLKVIGINVGDRRPEEFAPPVCETPTPTTPTVPPGETPTTAPPGPTTVPPKTVPPTTGPGDTTTTTPGGTTTTVPGGTTTTVPSGTTTTIPGSTTTTSPTTTTIPCPGDKPVRMPDGTCGVPYTTVPRSSTTVPPVTTRPTTPPTAPPDTTPVTPTTWDDVPTPSTIQDPDGPPVTATPPTTAAPPDTAPPTTNSGTVCPPQRVPCG